MLLGSGCARQQEESGGPVALGFGIHSPETRGNALLSVNEITTLGVFGYTTGTSDIPNDNGTPVGGWAYPANLLSDQKVTRDASVTPNVWTYVPQAFWPIDPTLKNSFFAYSPHSSEFEETSYAVASVPAAGGAPTLRYRLPETIAGQKDVLYARPVYNVNLKSTDKVTNGMVKYRMEHSLTWLAFVVAPASVGTAVPTGETYSVNRLSFMADGMPLASTLDLETGVWGAPSLNGNVHWDFILDPDNSNNLAPGRTARLTDDINRMMIFPFDLPRGMATVDITYYYNASGNSYDPATETYVGTEYNYRLPIPETTMEPGIVVVYLINISAEGASVVFKGTNRIEAWIEGGVLGGPGGDLIEMF